MPGTQILDLKILFRNVSNFSREKISIFSEWRIEIQTFQEEDNEFPQSGAQNRRPERKARDDGLGLFILIISDYASFLVRR